MKNLQNLKGAKALSKQEQQSINGGADGPCIITCANGATISGGPVCPSQGNIDAICIEIGGTSPGGCSCDPVQEK
jgi:hypothetical protein